MTNIATTHIKEEQKLKGNRNKEKKKPHKIRLQLDQVNECS